MALLLGPSGVGLLGLYGSIADLVVSVAGVGVNSSGVRQIAEAVGSGEQERVARTASVLRRTSVLLGFVGGVLVLALASPIASFTFGSTERAVSVALLSLVVFFRLIADGRAALIQGTRRLGDLARMNVFGAAVGALLGILAVYLLGEKGVVPALVLAAAMSLFLSWWYSKKIPLGIARLERRDVRTEQAALLKLGVVFMASGVMMMGSAYAIRLLVTRELGIAAAGLYQSAWAVGGLYVGLVLQAMGADFYPRLTAIASNNDECNRLVNEQARVSLLLAGPGVLATITLAPLIISILYTAEFQGAASLLRWLCVGVSLRVISWPLGFILIAKGDRRRFFLSEAAWTIAYVSLALIYVKLFGLDGAGMAFFGAYAFHVLLNYWLAHGLSGFRWSPENKRAGLVFLAVIGLVFGAFTLLPFWPAFAIGALATTWSSVHSVRVLLRLVSLEQVPRSVVRLLRWLRLAPGTASGVGPA